VCVLHEGNVVPWLIASEVLVHNGCQTAVEAYLLDEPAIAFQPVTSEDFDLQLPNLLSHRAFDQKALIDAVRAQLEGSLRKDPSEAAKQEDLIEQFVAGRKGPLACERIVGTLEAFAESPGLGQPRPLAERLLAGTVARGRGALQRVEAYWPGHHNNRVFLRHMFPGASLDEVELRIARYGELLGRFGGVRVRERHRNVFQVEAA
jgi:hypothetical protein